MKTFGELYTFVMDHHGILPTDYFSNDSTKGHRLEALFKLTGAAGIPQTMLTELRGYQLSSKKLDFGAVHGHPETHNLKNQNIVQGFNCYS